MGSRDIPAVRCSTTMQEFIMSQRRVKITWDYLDGQMEPRDTSIQHGFDHASVSAAVWERFVAAKAEYDAAVAAAAQAGYR